MYSGNDDRTDKENPAAIRQWGFYIRRGHVPRIFIFHEAKRIANIIAREMHLPGNVRFCGRLPIWY